MNSSLRCTKTYVLWASRGTIWGNVGSEGRYDVFAGKTLWSISERLTGCFMIRHYTNAQLYLFMEYHICSQAHTQQTFSHSTYWAWVCSSSAMSVDDGCLDQWTSSLWSTSSSSSSSLLLTGRLFCSTTCSIISNHKMQQANNSGSALVFIVHGVENPVPRDPTPWQISFTSVNNFEFVLETWFWHILYETETCELTVFKMVKCFLIQKLKSILQHCFCWINWGYVLLKM